MSVLLTSAGDCRVPPAGGAQPQAAQRPARLTAPSSMHSACAGYFQCDLEDRRSSEHVGGSSYDNLLVLGSEEGGRVAQPPPPPLALHEQEPLHKVGGRECWEWRVCAKNMRRYTRGQRTVGCRRRTAPLMAAACSWVCA